MKLILKGLNYSFALFLICVAIFLAYIAIPAFGNKALIVRSGSMEPTIKTGDLIVVRIASGITSPLPDVISKYKVGDTIAFKEDKNPNVLTTHKIVAKKIVDGKTMYQTKGDANKTPDTKLIAEEQIIGKSILTLPKVGKLFAYAKTKQGFALLVLIPALLVILIESTNLIKELFKINRARRMLQADPKSDMESGNLLGPIGLRVLLPIVISIMFFHNSYAYFSDSATSLNNTFTAASVFPSPSPTPTPSPSPSPSSTPIATPSPSPSPTVNPGDVVINEINWAGSDLTDQTGQNDEWIELRNTTSNIVDLTGWKISGAVTGDGDLNILTGIISANGFFLISNFNETTSRINIAPDLITTTLQLDNSNAQYILKDSIGNIIDTADDDIGNPLTGTNGPQKRSMERKTPPNDGTQAVNWQNATTHTNMDASGTTDEFGTPKAINGI